MELDKEERDKLKNQIRHYGIDWSKVKIGNKLKTLLDEVQKR